MHYFRLTRFLFVAFFVGTIIDVGRAADAQDEDRGGEFAREFWDYLSRAQYRNWAPAPNVSADFREGSTPHGAYNKLYVNRTAYDDLAPPAFGSILVLENYDSSKQLQTVTVMYRSKDTAPSENDWYWLQYDADGKVDTFASEAGRLPLAGRIESCITCHVKAEGKDYIYANDPASSNVAP